MNDQDERPSAWWAIIGWCLGGLALYVSVSLTVGLLTGSPVLGAVASGLVILGAVVAWRRWAHGVSSTRTVSEQALEPRFWVFVVVGLVLCFFGGQTLAVWLYAEHGSPVFDSSQAAQGAAPVALLLFALVVAAPAGEEALMRGLVYPLLRRRWPVLASALVSSAIFAVLHGNLVQIAVTLPLGVLLAFVYEHVDRLWPVVLAHASFNLASALVPVALIEAMAMPVVFSIALTGVVLVLVAIHPRSGSSADRAAGAERI
ncbi:CPBP family intramembrane glutamic endopeptidase [Nocardiopsis alba]|uniref:CPBP family intramembrane glutamic endopeptidase n=1 Tax=Nocardiopsis alba TaxID=53437 RepID=UPI0035D70F91